MARRRRQRTVALGDWSSDAFSTDRNVTLAGPFKVVDDKQGTIDPCGSGPLAPGTSTSCTSTHTITQADLDNGSITNRSEERRVGKESNTASATDTEKKNKKMLLNKE